jgi:hypothetical protein
MLLRASSEALGSEAKLDGAIGQGDGGVEHGVALCRFAEAATRGSDDLEAARVNLLGAVGPEAAIEAAATVGIFSGLVRVADATGVPLDEGTRKHSAAFRATLGLNAYAGARNTSIEGEDVAAPAPAAKDALGLFR